MEGFLILKVFITYEIYHNRRATQSSGNVSNQMEEV